MIIQMTLNYIKITAQSYFSGFMPNLTTFQDCWQAMLIQGQCVPNAASSLLLPHQKVLCQDPLAEVDQRARKPEFLKKLEAASSVGTPWQLPRFHVRVMLCCEKEQGWFRIDLGLV